MRDAIYERPPYAALVFLPIVFLCRILIFTLFLYAGHETTPRSPSCDVMVAQVQVLRFNRNIPHHARDVLPGRCSPFSLGSSRILWRDGTVDYSVSGHKTTPHRRLPVVDMLKKKNRCSTSSMFTYVIGMNFPMFRFERFSARENPASGVRPRILENEASLTVPSELNGQNRFWI